MKDLKKPKGGARPGAGRKPGGKNQATISKEQAREALRAIVLREMDTLVAAQVANAKGINYLVVRDKGSGKFVRVGELRAKGLKPDEETVEIWEKEPSTPAFTDLMNRALDKPKEQEQDFNVQGALVIKHEMADAD